MDWVAEFPGGIFAFLFILILGGLDLIFAGRPSMSRTI